MSTLDPKDKTCINYRGVLNDVTCGPWEPIPEAGTTLAKLGAYLNQCADGGGVDKEGNPWSPRRLAQGVFDHQLFDHGLSDQFWIPTPAQAAGPPPPKAEPADPLPWDGWPLGDPHEQERWVS